MCVCECVHGGGPGAVSGFADLVYSKTSSCCGMAETLLKMENGEGSYLEQVRYLKVKALRIVPDQGSTSCLLNVDGERMAVKPLEVRVFRGIISVCVA